MATQETVDHELRDRLYSAAHYEELPDYELHLLMRKRARIARQCLGDSDKLSEQQMNRYNTCLTHCDTQIKQLLTLK